MGAILEFIDLGPMKVNFNRAQAQKIVFFCNCRGGKTVVKLDLHVCTQSKRPHSGGFMKIMYDSY